MNDSSPVFNDDDEVNNEVEANEERHVDADGDKSVRATLEKAIRPVTNVLSQDPLDEDQREAQRRENDSEQSSS